MLHSPHGNDTKAKQKHQRSGSHINKSNTQKQQESSGDVVKSQPIAASNGSNAQQPAAVDQPRPWSPWIPGDDGRWFYQGRLKADGSGWEYQFTGGYPPASRRWEGNPYAAVSTAPTPQLPCGPPPIIAGQTLPGANRSITNPTRLEVTEAPDASPEESDDDGQEEDEAETGPSPTRQPLPQVHHTQYSQQPVHQSQAVILASPTTARLQPATTKPGSARQALVRHLSGRGTNNKQLSAIVKADKERRINSRKRIKSWLSEVTP
ncbi:hypothetical protein GE09DRAFT_1228004 [Coniochaeta sp. 2T2.1]|nr:hypothetical protein GE09DRAFT_1228004 [Coniochaeta sp. 2T2.1]